jgi:predicted RND superfamily exporter protein
MPLIFCLAMDNALQLAQFYRDRQPCSVRHAMGSLGRVVLLSCGLMVLLYGTLALAYYPAVRNFGAMVIYGAAGVSVGTVMLLPALLQLYGRGQPLLETLIVESDN